MRASWSIGAVLLSWPQIADAQSGPPPIRSVDIQLTNRVLYDSNIIRRPSGAANGTDERARDDFRITPGASIDILLPVSRQSVFLTGTIGYDFYTRNSRLNRERIGLSGGANLTAGGGCSSQLTGNYNRQQSDLADLFIEDDLKNTEERRGFGVRLNCGGAIGITPGLGYRHETTKNSALSRQRSNYTTNSYEADVGYSRPTFGQLSLFGRYSDSSYPNRSFMGIEDGVETYSTGISFQRDIGSRIQGSVSGGYTWVKPKLPGTPEFSGVSYSADITYIPTDRLRTSIGFSREAQLSNLLDISYSISENYRFSGIYSFGPNLELSFGTSYSTRDFERSPAVDPVFAQTGDKSYQTSLGLSRQWNRRLRSSVDVIQERRDSSNPFLDYKSTRVGMTLSLAL